VKIAIAITGASGAIYAKVLLDTLQLHLSKNDTVAIIWSTNAKSVWLQELPEVDPNQYSFTVYENNDFFSPIASGSSGFDVLIICPCSMGTLARIAMGISNDLITRTADVMLKERKKTILIVRESPYNSIHLKNMLTVTEAGGVIFPASPSFYARPKTFEQLIQSIIDRVTQHIGIEYPKYKWGEL
jgi:4-hydroxy-3-polyprenylbenzoate decarboxylase